MALPLGSGYLTMPQVSRSEPQMHSLPATCPKIPYQHGLPRVVRKCSQVVLQMEDSKNFIFQRIILKCWGGSKEWRRSFAKGVCLLAHCGGFKCELGQTDCCCWQLLVTQPNFPSQKSHLEEFNLLSYGVTSVTFIPNSTWTQFY